jgi:hypothetical protein
MEGAELKLHKQLQDEAGNALPGFSAAHCSPVATDSSEVIVR